MTKTISIERLDTLLCDLYSWLMTNQHTADASRVAEVKQQILDVQEKMRNR